MTTRTDPAFWGAPVRAGLDAIWRSASGRYTVVYDGERERARAVDHDGGLIQTRDSVEAAKAVCEAWHLERESSL